MNLTLASAPARSRISAPLFGTVATGLTLASASALSAEIVYNNTPVDMNFGDFALEIDDGGLTQLTMSFTAGSPDFFDGFKTLPGTPSSFSIFDQDSGALVTQEPAMLFDVVDGSLTYASSISSGDGGETYYGFQTAGDWFGWLKISHTPGTGNGSATLLEYAYDNSGAPIVVGATASPIPEPASAAALAAALAGSAAVLRRRRNVLAAA